MKRVKFAALAAALLTGAVAVSGGVSYIITKKLVELALDRGNVENQESIKKLLSGETNTEIFARYRDAAAEKLINTPHETVSITAHDGVKLVGILFDGESVPSRPEPSRPFSAGDKFLCMGSSAAIEKMARKFGLASEG